MFPPCLLPRSAVANRDSTKTSRTSLDNPTASYSKPHMDPSPTTAEAEKSSVWTRPSVLSDDTFRSSLWNVSAEQIELTRHRKNTSGFQDECQERSPDSAPPCVRFGQPVTLVPGLLQPERKAMFEKDTPRKHLADQQSSSAPDDEKQKLSTRLKSEEKVLSLSVKRAEKEVLRKGIAKETKKLSFSQHESPKQCENEEEKNCIYFADLPSSKNHPSQASINDHAIDGNAFPSRRNPLSTLKKPWPIQAEMKLTGAEGTLRSRCGQPGRITEQCSEFEALSAIESLREHEVCLDTCSQMDLQPSGVNNTVAKSQTEGVNFSSNPVFCERKMSTELQSKYARNAIPTEKRQAPFQDLSGTQPDSREESDKEVPAPSLIRQTSSECPSHLLIDVFSRSKDTGVKYVEESFPEEVATEVEKVGTIVLSALHHNLEELMQLKREYAALKEEHLSLKVELAKYRQLQTKLEATLSHFHKNL